MHFLDENVGIFIIILLKIVLKGLIDNVNIDSGYGLAKNRQRAITWTNVDPDSWCHMAPPDHTEYSGEVTIMYSQICRGRWNSLATFDGHPDSRLVRWCIPWWPSYKYVNNIFFNSLVPERSGSISIFVSELNVIGSKNLRLLILSWDNSVFCHSLSNTTLDSAPYILELSYYVLRKLDWSHQSFAVMSHKIDNMMFCIKQMKKN